MKKQQKNNKKRGNKSANIGKSRQGYEASPRQGNKELKRKRSSKAYQPIIDKTTSPPRTKSSKK